MKYNGRKRKKGKKIKFFKLRKFKIAYREEKWKELSLSKKRFLKEIIFIKKKAIVSVGL